MRKDEIPTELSSLAFDFFYWFSRFEFCLKENGYLKCNQPGANAKPGWDKFVDRHASKFQPSSEAWELLKAPPERQVVLANRTLGWQPVRIADCTSDLAKIARFIKTVRNNLFHGGKHSAAGWDNPDRTKSLLSASKEVLCQLAELGGFRGDYERTY